MVEKRLFSQLDIPFVFPQKHTTCGKVQKKKVMACQDYSSGII